MRTELEAIFARHHADPLDAFSQMHLATAVERAVYRRFASDPAACSSDAEIPFAARRDLAEVGWALERFADAGIVEIVEEGCYRWRPGFRYVLERTERFCSERCLAAFIVWPLAFTRPPGPEVDRSRVEDDHGP